MSKIDVNIVTAEVILLTLVECFAAKMFNPQTTTDHNVTRYVGNMFNWSHCKYPPTRTHAFPLQLVRRIFEIGAPLKLDTGSLWNFQSHKLESMFGHQDLKISLISVFLSLSLTKHIFIYNT